MRFFYCSKCVRMVSERDCPHSETNEKSPRDLLLEKAKRIRNKTRMSEIAGRLDDLQSRIDSGRFNMAMRQERDRLLDEYLRLEKEV